MTRKAFTRFFSTVLAFAAGSASFAQNVGIDFSHVKPVVKPTEIVSKSEAGYCDLRFRIGEVITAKDGSMAVVAVGLHNKQPVSFEIHLPSCPPSKSKFQNATIKLSSRGPESDTFARALAALYKTKAHPKKMKPSTTFTAITLEGDLSKPHDRTVNLKLFYDDDNENHYAEVFLNLNLRADEVELREKDPQYRTSLVNALTR